MGRTARNYSNGKLKLRTPKVVQSDRCYPIYIEYNWNADSMRKTTEVSVFAKERIENKYKKTIGATAALHIAERYALCKDRR